MSLCQNCRTYTSLGNKKEISLLIMDSWCDQCRNVVSYFLEAGINDSQELMFSVQKICTIMVSVEMLQLLCVLLYNFLNNSVTYEYKEL